MQNALTLNQSWQLHNAITTYCKTKRYPLWRFNKSGFAEENSDEQIAQWKLGFVAALADFHSRALLLQRFSAPWGNSARVFLSEGEANASKRRVLVPTLHLVTLEPVVWGKSEVIFSDIQSCTLFELISDEHGIDALVNRMEEKFVAPYSDEQDLIAKAFALSLPEFSLMWIDEEIKPVALLLCKTSSDEFIVLPKAWGTSTDNWLFQVPIRPDENDVFTLFDENGRYRFAKLNGTFADAETNSTFILATWVNASRYIHLKNSMGACVYEAATALQLNQRGAALCDLITSNQQQINPPGTKAIVGSLHRNNCLLTYAEPQRPYRVDYFRWDEQTYQAQNLAQISPLRWSAAYSSSHSLCVVQEPISRQWGFIGELGELLIPTKFTGVSSFYRGLARASLDGELWGVIDTQGDFVFEPKWKAVDWESAECIAVQHTDSDWGALCLASANSNVYELAGPFATEQQWLMAYDEYIRHRRGGWISADKTDSQKIVEAITQHWRQRKRHVVERAKKADSLAELEGVFEADAREKELSDAGIWRARVKVLRDQASSIFDIKAGDVGVINIAYPVSLDCFGLDVQAPVTEFDAYPDKVIGISWRDLQCLPSSFKKGLRFSCFEYHENDFLSNGFVVNFMLEGLPWKTAEHYYQADVYFGTDYERVIGCAATAREAQQLAKMPEGKRYRKKRAAHPVFIMLRAVAAKFCLSGQLDLIQQLLNTKNEFLIASFDPHKYWGEGKNGKGRNHLGRILMAIRAVLLQCDHENLQGVSSRQFIDQEFSEKTNLSQTRLLFEPLNAPTSDSSAEHLFERVVNAAENLLLDPDWNPAYIPPGIQMYVSSNPVYGIGIRQLREIFRPWLGIPLVACWGEDSFQSPTLILQAMDASQAPFNAEHGLRISAHLRWRMGITPVQTVGVRIADEDWREPTVATMPMPPWRNLLPSLATHQLGSYWCLDATSIIPTSNVDEFNRLQYFQPSAMAICLEFHARDIQAELIADVPAQFISLYAEPGEGLVPHIHTGNDEALYVFSIPYCKLWKLLVFSNRCGALPKIEAAFAKELEYW